MLKIKKKILVTGSSRGIGFAISQNLLNQGHQVVINGRNKSTLNRIKKKTKNIKFVTGDFTKPNDAKKMINSGHKVTMVCGSYWLADSGLKSDFIPLCCKRLCNLKNSFTVTRIFFSFLKLNVRLPYIPNLCLLPPYHRIQGFRPS